MHLEKTLMRLLNFQKKHHVLFLNGLVTISSKEIQANAMSTNQQVHVNMGTAKIKNSQYEKLLGVTIDAKLSLKAHIQQICGKASVKLKVFARIAPFIYIYIYIYIYIQVVISDP